MEKLYKEPGIEILAPAGGLEMVSTAIRCGANAVYLGYGYFNARRNAKGFSEEDLINAVKLSHINNLKVYLALNVIVFENEIPQVIDIIKLSAQIGIDAIIVQDLGVASLIKQICPDMPIHGSTQMSVHSVGGVSVLKEMGFDRVVLAREMTYKELLETNIYAKQNNIETEVFVHGAYCMCVSGQCYMSSVIGQRSGNRGICAQPCRLPFSRPNKAEYNLSLKDMSIIEKLPELSKIGVKSAKIEGRMKRPEYVAAAVVACRSALEKKNISEEMNTLRKVFSRTGFSSGFYDNKINSDMFGTRQKEDVVSAKEVLGELSKLYSKDIQHVLIKFEYVQKRGENISLSVEDDRGNKYIATGSLPQEAINKSTSLEQVKNNLSKLGGTCYLLDEENLTIVLEEGLFVPVSEINMLRRECIDRLNIVRSEGYNKNINDYEVNISNKIELRNNVKLRARFTDYNNITDIKEEILECLSSLEYVYISLKDILEYNDIFCGYKSKIIIEPPRVVFGKENIILEDIKKAYLLGYNNICVQNIGGFYIPEDIKDKFNFYGGYGLNCTNSFAVQKYKEVGLNDIELSLELDIKRLHMISGEMSRGVVGYGYIPLMITRNCPNKAVSSCDKCGGVVEMQDRKGNIMKLACNKYKTSTVIYNNVVLYMADRLNEIKNIDFVTLNFVFESQKEIRNVIYSYENMLPANSKMTRGLFYRPIE